MFKIPFWPFQVYSSSLQSVVTTSCTTHQSFVLLSNWNLVLPGDRRTWFCFHVCRPFSFSRPTHRGLKCHTSLPWLLSVPRVVSSAPHLTLTVFSCACKGSSPFTHLILTRICCCCSDPLLQIRRDKARCRDERWEGRVGKGERKDEEAHKHGSWLR